MPNTKYLEALDNLHIALKSSYNDFLNKDIDFNNFEISTYLLERMRRYYQTQYDNKIFLEKSYIINGADFFTEQLLFFIKIYLARKHPELKAFSEKQIIPKRGMIRPDISIWKGKEVIAIIECKTQLGWNRKRWEIDFNERENKLKKSFKNARAFLVVLTAENWGGFEDNELLGKKYFCLLKGKWITEYQNEDDIYIPIEKLFNEIL
ncbi:hypothetical protein [Chryseobacterium sp.]|uniref:hypothetical protein n=1 Tax=Chryseobacterium sp. TaxID=1871047 RepID=UPI002FC97B6A